MNSIIPVLNFRSLCFSSRYISTSLHCAKLRNVPCSINIFDRNTKTLQRQRAALAEDVNLYDYLKDEIGFRLADRVFDIKRKFKLAADIGCNRGYVTKHISPDSVEELIVCDVSQKNLDTIPVMEGVKLKKQILDEEHIEMCDNAIVGENNDCYMIWLAHNLKQMAEDILQFAIHDGSDVEATAGQYKKYMKDAVNFIAGSHLCQKYLYGSIGLDEFCAEMVDEDLGSFLINIPQLPYELLVKYGIPPEDDAETDYGDVYHNASEVETQCVQENEADPKGAEEK